MGIHIVAISEAIFGYLFSFESTAVSVQRSIEIPVLINSPVEEYTVSSCEGLDSNLLVTIGISNSSAYTCIGGGDSVSAINKFSDKKYFNHISTGGGASLEYLEGKKLPGVNKYKSLII